jgi:hypothetical protein
VEEIGSRLLTGGGGAWLKASTSSRRRRIPNLDEKRSLKKRN